MDWLRRRRANEFCPDMMVVLLAKMFIPRQILWACAPH